MKKKIIVLIYLPVFLLTSLLNISAQNATSEKTLKFMVIANRYFMNKWPDVSIISMTDHDLPGNNWTRGVYYEGLMALYKINPDTSYLNYALKWGQFHKWGLFDGTKTRNAENQCCGQTYIDLYLLDRYKEERIRDIRTSIDSMIATEKIDDWNSTDALQMAMPVFARLGSIYNNDKYFDRMNEMYLYTKLKHGTTGLYSTSDYLWWSDKDFLPPYKEPKDENCYWSRGNGWVVAALVRTLDFLPKNSRFRKEYTTTLIQMFEALVPLQRTDGFWSVSLKDPAHFGGKEDAGTALFVYGIAWGINQGVISKKEYLPVVMKAWNGIVTESVHSNGSLGYMQGTGKEPKDGQPAGYDTFPDSEDFGLGCFLLAGSEVFKLSKSIEPKEKEPKPEKVNRGGNVTKSDKKK